MHSSVSDFSDSLYIFSSTVHSFLLEFSSQAHTASGGGEARTTALPVDECPQGLAASWSGGSSDTGLVTLSFLFPFRAVLRIYEIWFGSSSKHFSELGRLEEWIPVCKVQRRGWSEARRLAPCAWNLPIRGPARSCLGPLWRAPIYWLIYFPEHLNPSS